MANLSNINDKFLVTTGGNVLIGQTGAIGSSILQVTGASTFSGNITGTTAVFSGSGTILSLNRNAPGTALIELKIANTIEGYLGATTTKSFVVYSEAGSEKAHVENNGNIGLYGSAINFLIGDFAEINFRESGAITIDSDNNQSSRNFQIKDGSGSTLLSVLDTGYVGINYASPSDYIHILGQSGLQSGSAGVIIQTNDTANAVATLKLMSRDASNVNQTINIQNVAGVTKINSNLTLSGGNMFILGDGGDLYIDTENVLGRDLLLQTQSGQNVGIGTTTPGAKLDVNGSVRTNGRLTMTGTGSANGMFLGGNWQIFDNASEVYGPTDGLVFYHGGSRLVIDDTGNVGIGETAPAHKLSIKATDDTRGILVNNTLTTSYAEVALQASREFRMGTGGSASDTSARDKWYVYDKTATAHRLTLDSSGNFGIGTTSPITKLSVHNSTETTGITDVLTVTCATAALASAGKGAAIRIGREADGNYSTKIATVYEQNNPNYLNPAMVFYTMYNSYLKGSEVERMRITSGGTILPGGDNNQNFGSSGIRWSVVYSANGVNTSDETLKENIKECDLGIDFINTLKPKSYNFKGLKKTHQDYGKKHYGLIAQDLKDGLLKDSVDGEKDGEYGLMYNDLIAPMIKAIQELKADNDSLKARIETLENN